MIEFLAGAAGSGIRKPMWREFYMTPPLRAIALDELERAARLRVRLLRVLVLTPSIDRVHVSVDSLPECAREALEALNMDQDLDSVAHYALRLAFCTDQERLEWLIDAECRLLSLRLRCLPTREVLQVLENRGLKQRVFTATDIRGLIPAGQVAWLQQFDRTFTQFCCVPFHEVSRLVGRRQVLLDRGVCWIPLRFMHHSVVFHYKNSLRQQLLALHRSLPAKRHEMERLSQLLGRIHDESMKMQQLSSAITSQHRNMPVVTHENIDGMAEKHFPLCMKQLHRKMRQNHHLKFDGRVQYRIFLKGLGFSVHDNILFFRNEFTKVIPPAKFDKEYVYHIRHSYGLEGSRKDYAPMICHQIITGSAPRHGQYHGCPFKHWDSSTLQQELRQSGVSSSQAESIARLAQEGHHQHACASFFEALHHRPYMESIEADEEGAHEMHPNHWVVASVNVSSPAR